MVQKRLDEIVLEDKVKESIRPLFEQATSSADISFEHDFQWQAYCDLLYAVVDETDKKDGHGEIYAARQTFVKEDLKQYIQELKRYDDSIKQLLQLVISIPTKIFFESITLEEREADLELERAINQTLNYLIKLGVEISNDENTYLPSFAVEVMRAEHQGGSSSYDDFKFGSAASYGNLKNILLIVHNLPLLNDEEMQDFSELLTKLKDYNSAVSSLSWKYDKLPSSFFFDFFVLLGREEYKTSREKRSRVKEAEECADIDISDYTIISKIGEGHGRRVYKAWDETDKCDVAIKIDKEKEDVTSENRRNKLKEYGEDGFAGKEAEAGRKLHHKNVARYYQRGKLFESRTYVDGSNNGRNYVIEEYVEGITLDTLIKSAYHIEDHEIKIPQEEFLKFLCMHILEGMKHIHDESCAHRDIKPKNILIPYSFIANPSSILSKDAVKVSDLELVKQLKNGIARVKSFGARKYSAPEVITDGRVSAAVDVFSFGIVLYQMYMKDHPFLDIPTINESEEKKRIAKRIVNPKTYDAIYQRIEQSRVIPEKYKEIIRKCIQYNPADRYQHAGEILAAVKMAHA
ncbi:serine/threonine protein kinase [Candidatus Woesearchaeota archaeon]|nr:serine/threonine protein kinase [Candidatus Woesearchaeota archaeon]